MQSASVKEESQAGNPHPDRIPILDTLRGLSVTLMVVYHGFFTFIYMFGGLYIQQNSTYWRPIIQNLYNAFHSPLLLFLEPFFAGLFIVIAGICCNFSKSNLRRGLIAFSFGMLLTVVTVFLLPTAGEYFGFDFSGIDIYFGILHLLGFCMIFYGLLGRWISKLPWPFMFLWLTLFAVTYPLIEMRFSVPNLYFLGFADANYTYADHFPILPWIFLFLFGVSVGRLIKEHKFPSWFYKIGFTPLSFVGRHSLLIYMAHQPVIYGIMLLVYQLMI